MQIGFLPIKTSKNILEFRPSSDWASQYKLLDNPEETLFRDIVFDDFLKYHRSTSICGLSVGFKILQKVLGTNKNFNPNTNVFIRGAFLGKGIKDSFEYIFKTSEGHIIKFDPCLDVKLECANASKGKYKYCFDFERKKIAVAIKPGVIPSEFIKTAKLFHRNEILEEDFRTIQLELCKYLVPLNHNEICNIGYL